MEKKLASNPKLVLFDIDGTLVKALDYTSRDSVPKAIKKVFGIEALIDWKKHDGSVDRKIFQDILKDYKIPDQQILAKLEDLFEERYNAFYQSMGNDYKKRLIREAKDLVVKLVKRGIRVGLLTGNLEKIARLKIETVGLDKFLKFGLFGNEAEDRISLAKKIFKKAKNFFGIDFFPDNIYIIGDTIKDITCGKAIGAKTIGVTTGFVSLSELKKAKPDLAVKTLTDPKVFKLILS